MNDDCVPAVDPLAGYAMLGPIALPRIVIEAATRLARERDVTVDELVRLALAEWLMTQGGL